MEIIESIPLCPNTSDGQHKWLNVEEGLVICRVCPFRFGGIGPTLDDLREAMDEA